MISLTHIFGLLGTLMMSIPLIIFRYDILHIFKYSNDIEKLLIDQCTVGDREVRPISVS